MNILETAKACGARVDNAPKLQVDGFFQQGARIEFTPEQLAAFTAAVREEAAKVCDRRLLVNVAARGRFDASERVAKAIVEGRIDEAEKCAAAVRGIEDLASGGRQPGLAQSSGRQE